MTDLCKNNSLIFHFCLSNFLLIKPCVVNVKIENGLFVLPLDYSWKECKFEFIIRVFIINFNIEYTLFLRRSSASFFLLIDDFLVGFARNLWEIHVIWYGLVQNLLRWFIRIILLLNNFELYLSYVINFLLNLRLKHLIKK